MAKKRKKEISADLCFANALINLIISALIGFALFITLSMMLNYLSINYSVINLKSNTLLYICMFFSSIVSGVFSVKSNNLKAIISGTINGIFLTLFVAVFISLLGKISFNFRFLIICAIIIISSITSAVIIKNFKK